MTLEEAGELILSGCAYEVCSNCEGGGRVSTPRPVYGKRHMGVTNARSPWTRATPPDREFCSECAGTGLRTRKDFAEAAQMVGAQLPAKPFRPLHVSGVQDVLGFDEDYQQWVTVSHE